MAKIAKKSAKSAKTAKSATKTVAVKKSRAPNPLHEKLIALMTRKDGATLSDVVEAGWKFAAMAALKIAERRGLKVSVVKKDGERTRYHAKRV
jgi:hypothetical protein